MCKYQHAYWQQRRFLQIIFMKTSQEYLVDIKEMLSTFDNKNVILRCAELTRDLYSTDQNFALADAEKIMRQLQNKRMFRQMREVGDALIQTGRHTFKIYKLYAQSLINQNIMTAAIAILNDLVFYTEKTLVTDESAYIENTEAKGLLGRAYKQLYVNASQPLMPQNQLLIKNAINQYYGVYVLNRNSHTWHGINTVALLYRAQKDGIDVSSFPAYKEIAKEILATIEKKDDEQAADAWDFATAAEACLALDDTKNALEWMSGYARMPYCDAFELASTLRQFTEVWKLDMNSDAGRFLLPLLRAELLKRNGSNVLIDVEDLQKHKDVEEDVMQQYSDAKGEMKNADGGKVVLEKVFGDESFKTYKWYMNGVDRCLAVARIGRDTDKGFGTGFLLQGNALHASLGDELFVITNSHVVSNNPAENALMPNEAVIMFEALNRDEEFTVESLLWTSPHTELNATIIRFSKQDGERLKTLTNHVKIYPITEYLPPLNSQPVQRIYIIGHPFGGTLQLSFQDNVLLDYEDSKIHYRTPTEGGSSGSPVFNQQWQLIGLHHAGGAEMKCLNNKPGTYNANEGIWIESIKKALCKDLGLQ